MESKAYQQLEKEDKSENYFESSAPSLKKKMRINVSKSKCKGRKIGLWRVNLDSEERRALGTKGEIQLAVFLENRDQESRLAAEFETCKGKALCVILRYVNALVYFEVG